MFLSGCSAGGLVRKKRAFNVSDAQKFVNSEDVDIAASQQTQVFASDFVGAAGAPTGPDTIGRRILGDNQGNVWVDNGENDECIEMSSFSSSSSTTTQLHNASDADLFDDLSSRSLQQRSPPSPVICSHFPPYCDVKVYKDEIDLADESRSSKHSRYASPDKITVDQFITQDQRDVVDTDFEPSRVNDADQSYTVSYRRKLTADRDGARKRLLVLETAQNSSSGSVSPHGSGSFGMSACEEVPVQQSVISEVYSFCFHTCAEYLWHFDAFRLSYKEFPIPHLYGSTCFGDNIEDEWYIVYLLNELSKQQPNCIIKSCDDDGEFLLIEAADSLPKWVQSGSMQNRVFLYHGAVHIIPRKLGKSGQDHVKSYQWPDTIESVQQAISILQRFPELTIASQDVQNAIRRRIDGYPAKTNEFVHYANVLLPPSVIALIRERPSLVAHAIHAFCGRDSIDLKICREMKYFKPTVSILARVRFTRCLYAQLSHQKFVPDQRSGFIMPTKPNDVKAYDLGLKLTFGFEILARRAENKVAGLQRDEVAHTTPEWIEFLRALKSRNYFQGEMEGSKLYQTLWHRAHDYFVENLSGKAGDNLLSLLSTLNVNEKQLREEATHLPPDDDEGWLSITPDMLEAQWNKRYGKSSDADVMTKPLSKFLGAKAGFSDADSGPNSARFDVENFSASVKKLLAVANHCESDSSDMDSYGAEENDSDLSLDDEDLAHFNKFKQSMQQYMGQMDGKFRQGEINVKTSQHKKGSVAGDSIDGESDNFLPVSVKEQVANNVVQSCRAESSGPSSAPTHSNATSDARTSGKKIMHATYDSDDFDDDM